MDTEVFCIGVYTGEEVKGAEVDNIPVQADPKTLPSWREIPTLLLEGASLLQEKLMSVLPFDISSIRVPWMHLL